MILTLTQCFPPDTGGIENLVGGLTKSLHARNAPVIVYADRAHSSGQDTALPFEIKRFGGPRPWRRWRKRRAVSRSARQLVPQAIIADSWKSIEAIPDLDIPIIVHTCGMELPANPSPKKRARIEAALARSALVIAISDYTKERTRPFLQPQHPVEIIHPPIDPQPVAENEAAREVAERLGNYGPVLLTVARLEPRKGIDKVIQALPGLRQDFPNIRYCIAGTGKDRERLEKLAADLGVDQAVQFWGRVSEKQKAALLDKAHLFVMPTRREGNSVEGFGISYIEAAWYGVPSIAGKGSGASEAVIHNETGLVCDGDDQQSVTGAIAALLKDEMLRVRLGQAAALRTRNELLWPHTIQRYMALIEEYTR